MPDHRLYASGNLLQSTGAFLLALKFCRLRKHSVPFERSQVTRTDRTKIPISNDTPGAAPRTIQQPSVRLTSILRLGTTLTRTQRRASVRSSLKGDGRDDIHESPARFSP